MSVDYVSKMLEFRQKFMQQYEGPPRALPDSLMKFRIKFMREELDEYVQASIDDNLEEQLDALVDLAYVVIGTALDHGFDFDEAFRRVHAANMRKEYDPMHRKGMRKPEGWRAPDLSDLVVRSGSNARQEEGGGSAA